MTQKNLLFRFPSLLCAAAVFAFSPLASAGDVEGAHFPDKCAFGKDGLVLNGTAVRSVWGFNVYAAGLYLAQRIDDDKTIMDKDRGGKRVRIAMLREVSAKKFESTIQENIDTNFSSEEKKKYASELKAFLACFGGDLELKKGGIVTIDYLPNRGTRVCVAGRQCDMIPGDDFYHAILRLWIGTPPQESVKLGLLGKAG